MSSHESLTLNSHMRLVGEDAPAGKTLLRAIKEATLSFQAINSPPNPASSGVQAADFCMIDSALQIDPAKPAKDFPTSGLGYAGFTPGQRAAYLAWLDDPVRPAPLAYQQLYIATLEVALFEDKREASRAQREMLRLDTSPNWHNHEMLDRAILLSFWLTQDGVGLSRWLSNIEVSGAVLSIAVGQLALLGQPATLKLLLALMGAWKLLNTALKVAVIELRLNSLGDTLGTDPFTFALAQSGEVARTALPWRCAHRDLRIAVAQPNLRPILEPLLRETTMMVDLESDEPAESSAEEESDEPTSSRRGDWNLVLEFEHSRSAYFPFALELAQRQDGYTVLLDENRRMVYRIIFRKSQMRTFWRFWDWVQPWGGTHVYVNGKELEKWQVWPFSQYLK